jgi:hypothetical protein
MPRIHVNHPRDPGESHHSLVIEMFRQRRIHDPYAFDLRSQPYGRRRPGAIFKRYATVSWSRALEDLGKLREQPCEPETQSRLGHMLRTLLDTTGWDREDAEIQAALQRGQTVRITLCLAAAELFALPWELTPLEPSGQYLGQRRDVLFRYTWPGISVIARPEDHSADPRILLAIASAGGSVPASRHEEALTQAHARSRHAFDPGRDMLAFTTRASLRQTLDSARDEGRPFSILHLLCHGAAQGQIFGLALDHEREHADIIHAQDTAALLEPRAAHLRCVVLSACDSGNMGALGNRVGSVAQAVHRLGIPWVIGARYPLSKRGSVRFAEAFYDQLLASDHADIEGAFLAARATVANEAGNQDWSSLQLYAAGAMPELSAAPAAQPEDPGAPAARESAPVSADTRAESPASGTSQAPVYTPPLPGLLPDFVPVALRHMWSMRLTRWLAVLAIPVLLCLGLYQIGVETHRSRLALIGVDMELDYGIFEQMGLGVRVLGRLLWSMIGGLVTGHGIERWSVPILLGVAVVPAVLRRCGHARAALVAAFLALAVLGYGTVLYANAASVHGVVMSREGRPWSCKSADSPKSAPIPGQIRLEVCSWLRNDTDRNIGRREAVGGLLGWLVLALALLIRGIRRTGHECMHDAQLRGMAVPPWRWAGRVAMTGAGIALLLLMWQAPRAHAVSYFGLRYPSVKTVHPSCDTKNLNDLLAGAAKATDGSGERAECNAVDISKGARQELLIIHGADCPGETTKPQLLLLMSGARPPVRCIQPSGQDVPIIN